MIGLGYFMKSLLFYLHKLSKFVQRVFIALFEQCWLELNVGLGTYKKFV